MISPLQPFKTRYATVLAPQQLTILTRCYQPIIGATSVSVYLTLQQLPLQVGQWANPMMHAQLMELLDLSAQQLTVAREQLEAVGLIRTYQRQQTGNNPLILYDLQSPLDGVHFVSHPLYSAMLYSRIGDQAYYQLIKSFELEAIDLSDYMEVSQSFGVIFGAPSAEAIQAVQSHPLLNELDKEKPEELISFDFARYYQLLRQAGIAEQNFTHQLRQQVQALHQLYGYNEMELAQITRLAVNATTELVEIQQLQVIAKRMKQSTKTEEAKVAPQQIEMRQQQIQQQLPTLTPLQAQVISLAENLPVEAFLNQVKQSKQGLMSSQESYNLKQVMEKTTLSAAIINLIVYYLLMIEKQETLFKSVLERTVDEWQQQQIQEVSQVFPYIEAKQKKKQQVSTSNKGYAPRKQQKTELIPEWLKQQTTNESKNVASNQSKSASGTTPKVNEAELQARLQQLLKAEES